MMRRLLEFYTDGAWSSKSEMGGWAAICVEDGDILDTQSGAEPYSTNNRMELMAVIRALTAASRHDELEIHTDRQYVKNGTQIWIKNWKKNNWRTANKKPVKNQDLWQQLDALVATKKIHWHWVRGHNGNEMNERVDELARTAAMGAK